MKEINMVLGARVRERRRVLKLTREQLAEKINISVRFMADVEGGHVGVSLSTLKELCRVLECSADFLIGIDEQPLKSEHSNVFRKLQQLPGECAQELEKIIDAACALAQKKNSLS